METTANPSFPAAPGRDIYSVSRLNREVRVLLERGFGSLWLSSHPGTASMGRLLMISLACELLVTLLFRPALLGRPPAKP